MKIERKTQESNEISTSSLPDIIFMLLIFFMVTTVMREFDGLEVIMPRAKMIEKLESKRNTSHIWATKEGVISVDDLIIDKHDPGQLGRVMMSKIATKPKLVVSLKSDRKAPMHLIISIHNELRRANALRLSYAALTKIGV